MPEPRYLRVFVFGLVSIFAAVIHEAFNFDDCHHLLRDWETGKAESGGRGKFGQG